MPTPNTSSILARQVAGSLTQKRRGKGVEYHREPVLEFLPEVVVRPHHVLHGELQEVGICLRVEELLHHRRSRIGHAFRPVDRQCIVRQGKPEDVTVDQGEGVGGEFDGEARPRSRLSGTRWAVLPLTSSTIKPPDRWRSRTKYRAVVLSKAADGSDSSSSDVGPSAKQAVADARPPRRSRLLQRPHHDEGSRCPAARVGTAEPTFAGGRRPARRPLSAQLLRMIAGLDEPSAGRVTVNGRDYRSAAAPMAELGVLLEAKA